MRLAVIVPRYGADLVGGAEALARGLAEGLHGRGHTVEVWTSCARDHFTWANELPAGQTEINGVTVRRFPISSNDHELRQTLQNRLAGVGRLPQEEQYRWLASGAHSLALYKHVAAQAAHFDHLLALPYAQALIHYAAWAAPKRTILLPCLHDEPYAYLEPVHLLLESVSGLLFNAREEGYLALKKLQIRPRKASVLGVGISATPAAAPFNGADSPYLLYLGRLEAGKNVHKLYEFVSRFNANGGRLRLVVGGRGRLKPDKDPAFEDRGFVSEEEKTALCAGALALVQPSVNESFSITIMESWLAGRPVLVNESCAVTHGHVARSKGGLWFETYAEFAGTVQWLLDHPQEAERMGQNGRRYVQQNYSWPAVIDRFEEIMTQWGKG